MFRYLRTGAFALIVIMAIGAIRPFSATDTFAAEPIEHRVILIMNRGRRTAIETAARTVEAFLEEQGIELTPYDNVEPEAGTLLEDRLTIRFNQGFYIDLVIDGESSRRMVRPGTTAGEVLSALQINKETALLFDGDKNQEVTGRTSLEFATWRSEEETTVELIPYPIERVSTPSLSQGVEKVRQQGVMGEVRIQEKVVFIGNEEHTREVLYEQIIYPVSHIIDRGIGGALGTLTNTNCPSFHYVRRIIMNATAYTAGYNCTGKHPWHPAYGITASGRRVQHGIVAVDPSVIPLGTRLYVEGYGFSLAADTGSAIRGYKIDLFMYDLEDARQFGRRDLTVFILD